MTLFKKTEKPWGFEELIEINSLYMLKKLTMWAGHRCSLQYHNTKRETIYILSGVLKITQGNNIQELSSNLYMKGDTLTIPPGLIHRMEGIEDAVYLEASTPEIDDVVRLSDDYNR
jgi:mannose-6-phosphate isomerase